MQRLNATAGFFCLAALLAGGAAGQDRITLQPPTGGLGFLTRPYRAVGVPPIRLTNSPRLDALMRGGNLYLTAQDAVALAIENNIDVEVQRYGPMLARQVLKRAQAGGALRSVGLPVAAGPQSVSLQGVSANTTGMGFTGGAGVSSGGGIVTQLGPMIPSFDPSFFTFMNFQHGTIPQSNTVLTGTTALIQNTRVFQAQYSQNWQSGTSATLTYSNQYVSLNSQFFSLNPYTTGALDLQITQNLLQGFGPAVTTRNIRVQRNNVKVSELQFKQQVITTVASVLNLYWDLVAFDEDVRARREALATAQQNFEDSKKRVADGELAEIEITRAEAQLYASQQDLVIAQTNLLQQETVLKNALTRNGIRAAGLTDAHVIPLDRISVPAQDESRPLEDLIGEALKNRPEIQQGRLNLDSNQMNLAGIKSSLKPTLQAFAELTNNGLTGTLSPMGALDPGAAYLAGGYGNLLGQIFRRNYPNYSAGFSLNIPLRNRAAQADYATSLLELRQNELNLQKNINQVRVDVQNAMIGLKQARARYEAAVKTRVLQQETLDADQKRYRYGSVAPFQVVQSERDLANAQSAEVQAMANYTHARIAMEQALGITLQAHHVSLDEAESGRMSQPSVLPAVLPQGVQQ
jgi:outer membrane protein